MIGKTILHYKIIEKLGEGGMGVVYLAEDTKLKRQVAIKFLPHHISSNEEERKRFEIEAQAAAALNHPNIATIHAIEEFDRQMFIVMEYIDGKELKDIIENEQGVENIQPLQTNDIINYAIEIAEGLEAAHKKGIVHRDIKSSNIMITNDGNVKIMDFGLAKIGKGSQVTKLDTTIGTIAYMSPEQTRGETLDQRTDIWSFGVVLYEMLTDNMPFRGDYDRAIIYSILNEEPEPVNEIDEGLKHIISKSLAKNPDDRYQTTREIVEELRTISQGGKVKRAKTKQTKLQLFAAGAAVIVIAIALYLFMPSLKSESGTAAEVKTLAILPFADMSPKKDQEYFSDGIAAELINVLSRNPGLRVIARTSSFSFKRKGFDIKTIASKLNVRNILEGSVRKSGSILRISANLINVKTDATLWSNTYDGTLNNIFALQDSISGNVAEALKVALLGKKASKWEQKTNPEAYNNYLLGNHFFYLYTKESIEKAEDYYEKALSIDSSYAKAWVSLAELHSYQADYGYISVDDGYRKARQEVEKALELNPNLGDAYSKRGWIKCTYDWDWKGAEKAFKKGLALEPENASVLNGAANLACTLGNFDEAIKLQSRAIKINPVNNIPGFFNLGVYYWYAGLPDKSISAFKKCLELKPQYPAAHLYLGLAFLEKGKQDSALAEIQKEKESYWQIFGLAIVYHALSRNKEADDKLAKYIKGYQDNSAYQIAELYAYRNEKDKAIEWLERAYSQRDGGCSQITGDPLMRNIVKDPRYTAFLKKMKLPL